MNMRALKGLLTPITALTVLLVAAASATRVDPNAYAGGRARNEQERLRRNSSALAAMLGEFRTSVSDILFMKTERYLHGGVGYLPHHTESALSVEELEAEVEEHQSELTPTGHDWADGDSADPHDDDEHHHGVHTVIPPPYRDFRGWVGKMYRQVRPWRDPNRPHLHTDGRDLLPWFRVMTISDPHYVRGYTIGGFWLTMEDEQVALRFMEEGLTHNPEAFALYVARAVLYLRFARHARERDPDMNGEARAWMEKARADVSRAAGLVLQQRPEDVDEDGHGAGGWSPYMENDAYQACRMDVVLTDLLGDPALAREKAARYSVIFPELASF